MRASLAARAPSTAAVVAGSGVGVFAIVEQHANTPVGPGIGTNLIDERQFFFALSELGFLASADTSRQIFVALDVDRLGRISIDTVVRALQDSRANHERPSTHVTHMPGSLSSDLFVERFVV
jgi:hypothetical protein